VVVYMVTAAGAAVIEDLLQVGPGSGRRGPSVKARQRRASGDASPLCR
jgi:hypothetical protein